MRNLTIIAIVAMLLCGLSLNAQVRSGVPATPHPFTVEQPNGDTLTVRLIGDERMSFRTTIDGYVIKQNKRGFYCYAKETYKGKIVASYRRAHNPEERSNYEKKVVEKMKKNTKLYRPR